MTHVIHGLTILAAVLLCAAGFLPSDQFLELAKWVVIIYASSTIALRLLEVLRTPATADLAVPPWAEEGVGLPINAGIFEDDAFADPMGSGVPRNYTSMVRDADAPPVTTENGDGLPVVVPIEHGPPIDLEIDLPPLGWDSTSLGRFYHGPRAPLPKPMSPSVSPPNRGLAEREKAQREQVVDLVVDKTDP